MELALGMLARRPLSEAEVALRLARRGYSGPDVAPVFARLRELRLLDDAALCRRLVRSYREERMYGPAKIVWKLLARGFPRSLAEEALREECPPGGTAEAAERALRKKYRGGIPAGRDGAARAYRFLAGRGFPPDVCRKAIGGHMTEHPEGDD